LIPGSAAQPAALRSPRAVVEDSLATRVAVLELTGEPPLFCLELREPLGSTQRTAEQRSQLCPLALLFCA
jgi:hypothetical protein